MLIYKNVKAPERQTIAFQGMCKELLLKDANYQPKKSSKCTFVGKRFAVKQLQT